MKFLIESTSLTPLYQDSTQSRVRRIIGRRRAAGLDRYIGVLRQGGGQDSIDPITELLSQLSSKVMSSSNGPVYVYVCVCVQIPMVGVAQGEEGEEGLREGDPSQTSQRTFSSYWISRSDKLLSEVLLCDDLSTEKYWLAQPCLMMDPYLLI